MMIAPKVSKPIVEMDGLTFHQDVSLSLQTGAGGIRVVKRPCNHVKQRSCGSCGKARPSVLFPKLSHGAYGKRCQLCVDTAKTPKDLVAFRTRGRRAQEKRAAMVKANRMVSSRARVRARENGPETQAEERETV